MPTDEDTAALDRQIRARRVIRLAFGTALGMFISQAYPWTLSFVAPILAMILLALPLSRPKAKLFITVVLALVFSVYGSFLFLPFLRHQEAVGLILLTLALFYSFYFTARGGPAVVGTFITIGLTLTVAVGSVSVEALLTVAKGLTIGVVVGAGIALISHAVLPDLLEPQAAAKPPADAAKPEAAVALRNAMRSMAIVLPITIWFLLSSGSLSSIPVMIKVAAMGQEASNDKVKDAAKSLVISTFFGGVAATVAWQVLAIWPSLTMYTLLVAIAGMLFGGRIFEGRALSADGGTWSYAFLTMLVILAPAALDSQMGSNLDAAFYSRLWMLMGASLYGVVSVYVFDAFWPANTSRLEEAQTQ